MAHSNGVVLYNLVRYLSTDFAYQCSTLGLEEAVTAEEGFRAAWNASGELVLHGLTDGMHTMRVYDAQGRLVLDKRVESIGGISQELRIPLQHGVYLLRVAGQGAIFVPLE